MKRALVVAVHPDDETLGCGGTILKHRDRGDEVYWVILTRATQEQGYPADFVEKRDAEMQTIAKEYGFAGTFRLGFSTTKLDECSTGVLVRAISKVFQEVQPNIVYLPFKGDVHSDHRVAFDAAFNCTKSFRCPSIQRVLMMETLSETEFACPMADSLFVPNVFSDISGYLDRKLQIMAVYDTEVKEHPFPRSARNITALATYRGATAGYEYAESFMLLKEKM